MTTRLYSIVILDIPRDGEVSLSDLEERLRKLKGVGNATVYPVTEKVRVEFDPLKISIKQIRATLLDGAEEKTPS